VNPVAEKASSLPYSFYLTQNGFGSRPAKDYCLIFQEITMDDRLPRSLTLLILSGDLEKGLAACNLALAALAGNRRVTLFFSFWGLNFLKRPGAKGAGSLLARVLGLLNRDNAESQRSGRFNVMGAGRWALLRLMGRYEILPVHEGLAMAHQMGARIVACSNTLQLLGLNREGLIGEVDDIAGALTFLEAADEGTVVTLS
jgi:peroxiredoxin family protein